jgi:hypothetical protein
MIKKILFSLTIFSSLTLSLHSKNGISYRLTRGRLGDQMITYAQAVWFATMYKLDFFYKPFHRSENFFLHTAHDLVYDKNIETSFDRIVPIAEYISLDSETPESIMYLNSLNTKKSPFKNLDSVQTVALEYPWFKKMLQKLFTPVVPIQKLTIPNEYISVAVHVRTGSGTDRPCISRPLFNTLECYHWPERIIDKSNLKALYSDERYPNKFPPYQFYIDQIDLLIQLFPNKKFLIYIFTDHKNPMFIVNLFSKQVQSNNQCIFKTHSPEIQKTVSVEDDFYWMAQCDFLIRAGSNLSRAAQLFGNHKVVIHIKKARWHGNAVVPDSIGIITYNKNNQAYAELNLSTADIKNERVINNIKETINRVLGIPNTQQSAWLQ